MVSTADGLVLKRGYALLVLVLVLHKMRRHKHHVVSGKVSLPVSVGGSTTTERMLISLRRGEHDLRE